MNRAIPDETAIAFAAALYQGLSRGESVRTAFESSLLQLDLLGDEGYDHGLAPESLVPGTLPSRDLVGPGGNPASIESAIPELMERPGSEASHLVLLSSDSEGGPTDPSATSLTRGIVPVESPGIS